MSKEFNNGKYVITPPKTRSSNRNILLDDESIKLLNELKSFYQKHVGFNENWFVFGGLNSLTQSTVNRRKNEYCIKAGFEEDRIIKIHDLRHSHASLLLSEGVPVTVISKRLGHADIATTLNTYSHLMPNDEDKAVDLINKIKKNFNSQENFKRIEIVDIKKSPKNKALLTNWSGNKRDF